MEISGKQTKPPFKADGLSSEALLGAEGLVWLFRLKATREQSPIECERVRASMWPELKSDVVANEISIPAARSHLTVCGNIVAAGKLFFVAYPR